MKEPTEKKEAGGIKTKLKGVDVGTEGCATNTKTDVQLGGCGQDDKAKAGSKGSKKKKADRNRIASRIDRAKEK